MTYLLKKLQNQAMNGKQGNKGSKTRQYSKKRIIKFKMKDMRDKSLTI